ncbi:MAG: protein translocase SEC61 complex subunit gamma [Thermoplasmatota archaeon]
MATTTVPRQESQRRGMMGRAWDVQSRLESRIDNIGKGRYGRVIKMARKPTPEEWAQVAKVTSIGMVLIGAIGFVIYFSAIQIPHLIQPLIHH